MSYEHHSAWIKSMRKKREKEPDMYDMMVTVAPSTPCLDQPFEETTILYKSIHLEDDDEECMPTPPLVVRQRGCIF